MAAFNEKETVQQYVLERITNCGFTKCDAKELPRELTDPYIPADFKEAVLKLNPAVSAKPGRYDEIQQHLVDVIYSAHNHGLITANQKFIEGAFSGFQHQFQDEDEPTTIHLFDVATPSNNILRCAQEVIFKSSTAHERFDFVLFINGLPVVVGEAKSVTESYKRGIKDINDVYLRKAPEFFVSNILNFVTNGFQFRYGSLFQPDFSWQMWGSSEDPYDLADKARVDRSIDLLLTPSTLLNIGSDFTLFLKSDASRPKKIIPRYIQMEAAEAIYNRFAAPKGGNGLIHHYQGTGKTLLMVYTALKVLQDPKLAKSKVLIGVDRIDLEKNVFDDFKDAGIGNIQVIENASHLRKELKTNTPGIIITTIFKFKDVDVKSGEVWNTSESILVMIDEAHRTQDGDLGKRMRQVIPNARFFGMTGTPINEGGRNTFELFGNDNDPGKVLSKYSMERAIADGTSVPINVEPRLVDWNLDEEALDEAFEAMAQESDLDDAESDYLSRRAGKLKTVVLNPERITAVCSDILDVFAHRVAPLGFKAQVVALDREMCVLYEDELNRLIKEKGYNYTTQVVMTSEGKTDQARGWDKYGLTRAQEHKIIDKFNAHGSAPDILIVTAKLLTGFNAPIEQAMFVDKPFKKQTLFQAITRTNRTYANPETGQEKERGIIIDYIGISKLMAKALRDASPENNQRPVLVDEIIEQFEKAMKVALSRFEGIDRTNSSFETFAEASKQFAGEEAKKEFRREFWTVQGMWETLYPEPTLEKYREDYSWLGQLYEVAREAEPDYELLWEKLGAKTTQLVHEAISDVRVKNLKKVEISAETVDRLRELNDDWVEGGGDPLPLDELTAEELLDTIDKRIKSRMESSGATVYVTLAEKLENLRQRSLNTLEETESFIEDAIKLAQQLLNIDRDSTGEEPDILQDNVGALTQIVQEYKPEDSPIIVDELAKEIDQLAKDSTYSGWTKDSTGDRAVRASIRKKLKNYKLPLAGKLFDEIYDYIASHY